ncbi:MAG: lyase family protein, partial [Cyclobacteriaceae bacterium]
MDLNQLSAISPVDGRYHSQSKIFAEYFSEYGLIKYRVMVEIEYFIALVNQPLPQLSQVDKKLFIDLRDIYRKFSIADAEKIKQIEKTTNHDVKAVEYFLKQEFDQLGLAAYKEFIHFGLTSQDINNTAIPLSLRDFHKQVYLPSLANILELLTGRARQWQDIPMLARTHGQPASPTRLGKELMVFCARLQQQLVLLDKIPFAAKFGGATGNFNAHFAAYPQIEWHQFADNFI